MWIFYEGNYIWNFLSNRLQKEKNKQKEINNNKGKCKGKVKQRDYKEKWNQKKEKKIQLWVTDETILSIKYWGWMVDPEGFILRSFLCAVAKSKISKQKATVSQALVLPVLQILI